jgi:hypothetical protein
VREYVSEFVLQCICLKWRVEGQWSLLYGTKLDTEMSAALMTASTPAGKKTSRILSAKPGERGRAQTICGSSTTQTMVKKTQLSVSLLHQSLQIHNLDEQMNMFPIFSWFQNHSGVQTRHSAAEETPTPLCWCKLIPLK